MNGVTPRQSHHLSIVWAKPSKSTANRFCLPSLLVTHLLTRALCSLRSPSSSFAPRAFAPTPCMQPNLPFPSPLAKEPLPPFIRRAPTSNSPSLPRSWQGTEIETFLSPEYLVTYVCHTGCTKSCDDDNERIGKNNRRAFVASRDGEDRILNKASSKLCRTKMYTCIFRHVRRTSGEPITWECESRRSRRRKKKNRMDVISSRGIGFFEIYILYYSPPTLGNRNERSEWKRVTGRADTSLSSGKCRANFVNSRILIDSISKRCNVRALLVFQRVESFLDFLISDENYRTVEFFSSERFRSSAGKRFQSRAHFSSKREYTFRYRAHVSNSCRRVIVAHGCKTLFLTFSRHSPAEKLPSLEILSALREYIPSDFYAKWKNMNI